MLLACFAHAQAPPTVAGIETCMRANVPATLQIKEFALQSVDRNGGERLLKGRLYAMREQGLLHVMMKVDSPADLRGAAYLLREGKPDEQDAMYMFLPALNKIRRIVGGTQDNPLFGTDISYADIKQINHAFGGGRIELEKTETYEGRDAYVLKLTPDAAQQSRFSLIRTWVDRQSCVALRADFMADGAVRKRFTAQAGDLRQSGPYWYAARARMDDLGASTYTRLEIEGVSIKDGMSGTFFNPLTFNLSGG